MDALAEIRTKLAAVSPAAMAAFKGNPQAGEYDAAAKEWLRLRNLELKLEREVQERDRASRACGIPPNFAGETLADYPASRPQENDALQACYAFMDAFWSRMSAGEHATLWFLGPTGTGKTRLASALVTDMHVNEGVSARLVTPTALIRQLRDTWGQKGKEQALLEQLAGVQVLVLDDVGRSFGSAFEVVQITELIDLRYAKGHPTVITSNMNEPQLKKALGDRAFDRLRHGRKIVPLTGDSYRRPN